MHKGKKMIAGCVSIILIFLSIIFFGHYFLMMKICLFEKEDRHPETQIEKNNIQIIKSVAASKTFLLEMEKGITGTYEFYPCENYSKLYRERLEKIVWTTLERESLIIDTERTEGIFQADHVDWEYMDAPGGKCFVRISDQTTKNPIGYARLLELKEIDDSVELKKVLEYYGVVNYQRIEYFTPAKKVSSALSPIGDKIITERKDKNAVKCIYSILKRARTEKCPVLAPLLHSKMEGAQLSIRTTNEDALTFWFDVDKGILSFQNHNYYLTGNESKMLYHIIEKYVNENGKRM